MKIGIIIAALLGLLAGGAVQAEGFYVGAGLQSTQFGVDDITASDATTTGFRLSGGYQFSSQLSAELSYLNSGWASWQAPGFAQYELRAQVVSLSLIGAIPLGDRWGLFAKAGYYDGETNEQVWVSGLGSGAFNEDIDGLMLGVGLRHDVGRFAWRLEYDWFDVDYGSAKSLGLNAQVRF